MTRAQRFTYKRLEKSLKFWDTLREKQFYLGTFVSQTSKDEKENICGTVCCLVGWLPAIEPNKFTWSNALISIQGNSDDEYIDKAVMNHFKIDYELYRHLFVPKRQTTNINDYKLYDSTSLEDVLDNVRDVMEQIKGGHLDDYLTY